MKTSSALKKTKKLVWDGIALDGIGVENNRYICHAASSAGVGRIVQAVVLPLLCPYRSLETWLATEHGIEASNNIEKLQATRHAWLDNLIAHYESIGD